MTDKKKRKKNYIVQINKELVINTKIKAKNSKNLYGVLRMPSKKLTINSSNKKGDRFMILNFRVQKDNAAKIKNLFHKPPLSMVNKKTAKVITDIKSMDILASFLNPVQKSIGNLPPEEQKEALKKLKRKIKKYRKRHLGNININTNIRTSKSDFGNDIGILNFIANKSKKISRSKRKKINRANKKKREETRKFYYDSYRKHIKEDQVKEEKKLLREATKKERLEAMFFLDRLKTYTKATKGTTINPLDLLFSLYEQSNTHEN